MNDSEKCRRLSLGIIGLLVVFGGTMISILILLIMATWNDGFIPNPEDGDWSSIEDYSRTTAWALGFAYIIPGVIFILAALIQHKAAHVLSSIIGLLAVLVLGLVAILAAILLIGFVVSQDKYKGNCFDTDDGCKCNGNTWSDSERDDDFGEVLPFRKCHYLFEVMNQCVGLVLCAIFSWIFLLTASIMAICYSCRSNPQPGMVYTPLQEQQVVVSNQTMSQVQPQPQPQPMYQPGEFAPYHVNPSSPV